MCYFEADVRVGVVSAGWHTVAHLHDGASALVCVIDRKDLFTCPCCVRCV
jgi:hypothetical protein